jgi:pimeloyl-ACP methyl ester carboxylesterase
MSFLPSHLVVGPADAKNCALLVHGILGSAKNLYSFARQLQQKRPEWCLLVADLRGHAGLLEAPPPHTIHSCSEDLRRLMAHLGKRPRVLLGHSFGGKVCLQYVQDMQLGQHELEQLWLLDSNPATVPLDEKSEVSQVFAAARRVTTPIAKRADVADAMRAQGLPDRIATWMTTNLRHAGDHYEWTLSFDIVEQLLADYREIDFWPFISAARTAPQIHWVIGEQSDRIDAELRERARAVAEQNSSLRVHLLPNAGHWVHVDNPSGLVELLDRDFPQ